jgi:hypothetical protein
LAAPQPPSEPALCEAGVGHGERGRPAGHPGDAVEQLRALVDRMDELVDDRIIYAEHDQASTT